MVLVGLVRWGVYEALLTPSGTSRGELLGRVLLCQLVYVAVLTAVQLKWPTPWSFGAIILTALVEIAQATILTTAFTLLYVDLARISADEAVADDVPTPPEGSVDGDNISVRPQT